MTADFIVFSVPALAAIVATLGMLLGKNAVYSTLFPALNFGTAAIFRTKHGINIDEMNSLKG
ncbi:MAG: hypothetical protein HYR70_10150 [Chloroflexi bacterium]|nr:hypothetical protein [Chloroflexota bacterium]MBI1856393.1 hypothetical protein [Chloroflexota bacterium]MBI2757456.1 hypothetical protein [Chloroflexota bacterium]MBI3340261.1 hypothetical protein [Chloroflexota bacterium]